MLNCKFCKRVAKESDGTNLPNELKEFLKRNDFKSFDCECGASWFEVNENKEFFDLNIFGRDVKTFNDFKELMKELKDNLSYYTSVPIIEDCVNRMNDWLTSKDLETNSINDSYIQNQLNIIKKTNEYYYLNN